MESGLGKWSQRPVYAAGHDDVLLVLVRLVEYPDRVLSAAGYPVDVVQELNDFHLRVEELAHAYGLCKVDSHEGDVILAGNLSTEHKACQPDEVLDFTREIVRAYHTKYRREDCSRWENPVRVVLSRGSVTGAILGGCGLRYGIHGKPYILTYRLANTITEHGVIATDCFVRGLTSTHGWIDLEKACCAKDECTQVLVYCEDDRNEESSLDFSVEANRCKREKLLGQGISGNDRVFESACHSSETDDREAHEAEIHTSSKNGEQTGFTELTWLANCSNGTVGGSFKELKVEKIVLTDFIYLSLALLLIQSFLWQALEHVIVADGKMAYALFIGLCAILTTLIPLFAICCARWMYLHRRLQLWGAFHFFWIKKIIVNNFLAPMLVPASTQIAFLSRLLVSNSALLHGMHALGARISNPLHCGFKILAVATLWASNYLCSKSARSKDLPEYSLQPTALFAWVLQLTAVMLMPAYVAYNVETIQGAPSGEPKHVMKGC